MDKEELIKILKEKDIMLKRLSLEKEKLNYYASTDVMTGVLNRRSGLERLIKEFNLSKTNGNNLIICYVDVDRLKIINDTFGHKEGDKVLISAAKVLKGSIRKTDFVTRIGGDEFLLAFPVTTIKEVNKVWYRICRKVEEINKNNADYNLSLSYGFCEYNKEMLKDMSINDLIQKADVEMYRSKLKKKEDFNDICTININMKKC